MRCPARTPQLAHPVEPFSAFLTTDLHWNLEDSGRFSFRPDRRGRTKIVLTAFKALPDECRGGRLKHGSPSTHPLRGPELRALRAWKREQGDTAPFVFTSLRCGPMTRRTVHHVVAGGAKAADIEFPVHPHMLRHGTGIYLANAGQDTRAIQMYLGHKNIQHTTKYTELAPDRFKNFWKD